MVMRQIATAKAEETRERILSAALALFRERGFDATTMRDVATEAGVATGAAYYYFRSKEELVMAFYLRTAEEMRDALPPELGRTRDLKKRLATIIDFKFAQFADHRSFLSALFRTAVDPDSPLSPFGDETAEIREESVAWFRQALEESSTSVPRDLAEYLPNLLWLYQMGLILFWLYDRSPKQQRTRRLADSTLDLIVRMIKMSSLPLLGQLRRPTVNLLKYLYAEDK